MEDSAYSTNPAPGFVRSPDHMVKLSSVKGTVIVSVDGTEIARSSDALLLEETNHSPVYYMPMEDVDRSALRPSTHVTRCPFKGKARHWNIAVGEHEIDNAMWAYELPYDEMLELAGLVAFYQSKVAISIDQG